MSPFGSSHPLNVILSNALTSVPWVPSLIIYDKVMQRGHPDSDSLQVRDLIVLYDVDLAQNLGYDTFDSTT